MSIWQYFSVFLTLDLLPFFFCVESTVSFFPSKQPTNNRGIHPHLDPLASVWWASEPIPPKCRWHAPCGKQFRPLSSAGWTGGVHKGGLGWDLEADVLNVPKHLFLWVFESFHFSSPKNDIFCFPDSKKTRVKKWWSPSWEFKDGPFLFFDLKQSSGKIWKLCAASQSIIMKLDILRKTMRTCSKGVAIYGPFWRVWRMGNSTCMSFSSTNPSIFTWFRGLKISNTPNWNLLRFPYHSPK